MISEKHYYAIALSLIEGIGSINAKKIIAYTGGIESVFKEKKSNLSKIPGISNHIVNEIVSKNIFKKAEEEIRFIEKNHVKVLYYEDFSYPYRLKHCNDSPIVLYTKGSCNLNAVKIVAIVGTRNATDYGKEQTENIVFDIAQNHPETIILSGLAYGIDISAHKAALKYNLPTVAILGHGLNIIYPGIHSNYAKEILENGCLVTEFSSSDKLDKALFVRRNRIIAGMSDVCIIVESGEKGGAIITIEYANAYNRETFAVPGKISSHYSKGCHRMIAEHKAHIYYSFDFFEYIMNWKKNQQPLPIQTQLFYNLNDLENKIFEIIKKNKEISIDFISLEAQEPVHKVSAALLNLEFAGLVKSLPGKIFKPI